MKIPLIHFLKNFLSVFLLLVLVFIIVSILNSFFITELNSFNIHSERPNPAQNYPNDLSYKIIAILVVPFVEEVFYRLGLKFSIRNTTFFILGILYTLYLFFQPDDLNFNDPIILLLFFGTIILGIVLIWFGVRKNAVFFESLYAKHSKSIFWLSVIVFTYSHFILHQNHDSLYNIIFSPIILFPYVIAGILYGVIRIKFGFLWGCLAHMLWNFLVVMQIIDTLKWN